MSKPCRNCPAHAAAWLRLRDGTHIRLCHPCLNHWFDEADDRPELEPRIWGWLVPPAPAPAANDIATWAKEPRNHQYVAEVLRREARIDPHWLRDFLRREHRAGHLVLV
ncbi:hypothetical protein H1V43_32175 [Streptomyces sp. PSKA54]|uniref:Uncharacterized protein n=1 Tax=Streptomyces himalayensis subsp. aureolus TaxID=2758039 RepID=A0A7W2HJA9_9ACTN|nr:hypothetical protein [Streptomyces himalayensis]MBA4865922.1 hypothetical protein [Streptomyces himalayensis subsp. aureolus]